MTLEITREELLLNNGEDGNKLWVLIDGKVYDLTKFKHPGGRDVLLEELGEDRKDEFESIHSPAAKQEMKQYCVGVLKEEPKQNPDYKKTDGDTTVRGDKPFSYFSVVLFASLVLIILFIKFVLN